MNYQSKFVLSFLNKISKNTLIEILSIEFINFNGGVLIAKMPINSMIYQPYGLVHGGIFTVLAETVGSSLSVIHTDRKKYQVLGIKISTHHLSSIKNGILYAKASFLKKGRSVHSIKIESYNEHKNLIAFSLLTNFIKKINYNNIL